MTKETVTTYPIDGPWNGRLAIVPRPRGGDWLEDELRAWREVGIDVIVSLLTPDEVAELGLEEEGALSEASGVRFLEFPIPDRSVPSSQESTLEFVGKLEELLTSGNSVGVHCRQGIGRSALIAACLLVMSDIEPATALQRISVARGYPVPETEEQREWLIRFTQRFASRTLQLSGR
jgi:protein-tyrosine phosphatase